jgi:hypothetical protein
MGPSEPEMGTIWAHVYARLVAPVCGRSTPDGPWNQRYSMGLISLLATVRLCTPETRGTR